jgi:CheY-like chemotaxis protein
MGANGRKKRILLIENDSVERQLLVEAITEDNFYEVIPVKNGLLALQYLSNADRLPDLIVTEYRLPTGGGLSLLKSLKGIGIPVIVLTAVPRQAVEETTKAKLKFPIIAKPCEGYSLLAAIDSLTLSDVANTVVRKAEDFF